MGLTQVSSEGIKDGEIKDADVNASAAIAKSKLASLDIVNADVNASAAIAGSKLAAATTSAAGSMSAADKTKLDGVADSATANPSAPALTGSTNNTICTVTGANAIQGEANLTFDGSTLSVSAESEYQIVVKDSNTTGNGAEAAIAFKDSADATLGLIGPNEWANGNFKVNNSTSGGSISFETHDGTSVAQRASISSSGHFTIDDGNLVIGTAGKGIDFSAASGSASGATASVLDDYEEGTFTTSIGMTAGAVTHASGATTSWTGYYVKTGNMCHVHVYVNEAELTGNGSGWMFMDGLPFTSHNGNYCAISITHNTLTYHDVKNGYVQPNNTIMYPVRDNSTAATFCNTGSARYLMFGGTYRTT